MPIATAGALPYEGHVPCGAQASEEHVSTTTTKPKSRTKPKQRLERVTIRFAGDSGDGVQVTGNQFSSATALAGNDLATMPDYPAEIRAPAGTLAGVSGFQVQFASSAVYTPGDRPDVLVAFNPAALRRNLPDLHPGAVVVLNRDAFDKRALARAGFEEDPREDGTLEPYRVYEVPITSMTLEALADSPLSHRAKERSKNFFALGLMAWLYGRPLEFTEAWIREKFANKPEVAEANLKALRAGYNYGETAEIFSGGFEVPPAVIEPGLYRHVNGNQALALGLVAASQRSGLPLFLGSYPITPASDVLHELSRYKAFGVTTFQAEDEIAAVTSAIGAAYGGTLAATVSSGPGIALKMEAIGLAVAVELPLVVVDIQRAGPSTGMPTKTEQADLLQVLFGRPGEAPVAALAPATPGDCFWVAIEAARQAIRYMTPVFVVSDGYLANSSEPWKVPEVGHLPSIEVHFRTDAQGFFPFVRDPDTLARPWVRPGTPGLEHRIGGLEHSDPEGSVSYDPENHERMVALRAEKIARIAREVPEPPLFGDPEGGDLLLVGWGSTYGALRAATETLRGEGAAVSHLHLRQLWPLPPSLGETLRRYRKVAVAEINTGQMRRVLRSETLVDIQGINAVRGQPFRVDFLVDRARALLHS